METTLKPINQHAPIRPRSIPDFDRTLLFATMPQKTESARYQVTAPKNMIAQMRLYRAVREGAIPLCGSIQEIYDYVFFGQENVSKNTMGATVIRTVLYNPRRLKGVTKDNDKAMMTYTFHHLLELQYGLEWMLCTWLRKFLNEGAAPGGQGRISGPDMMAQELDILADTPEKDYLEVYEEPVWDTKYSDPDWEALVSGRIEIRELSEKPREMRAGGLKNYARPSPPKSMMAPKRL